MSNSSYKPGHMTPERAQSENYDIAIVGAGLVGAATALALSELGLKIALVDAGKKASFNAEFSRTSTNEFSARVSAITPSNAEFLSGIGAWGNLAPEMILPYQKMTVWDHLGTANIEFNAAEYQRHELGFIVENQNLVAALHTELDTCENVSFYQENRLTSCALEEDSRLLNLSGGECLRAKLVVGADGSNSSVRKLLGVETREWDYEQTAIVCTVESERAHEFCARQRFSEQGPIAFLPLADTAQTPEKQSRFCSLVWSLNHDEAKKNLALDDLEFAKALQAQSEGQLGEITEVSARFAFPLRQMHAKSYIKPCAVLLGDAAHAIHPLAGQGVNLGFKDAASLVAIIKQACEQEAELNHPVFLRRYQRQRQFDNMRMMGSMEGFKRLFGHPDPILRLVRNVGLGLVNKHTLVKRQIVQAAMGLS